MVEVISEIRPGNSIQAAFLLLHDTRLPRSGSWRGGQSIYRFSTRAK